MWAQRQGTGTVQDHDTMALHGDSPDDVAAQINDLCTRFCVRVAHVSAYHAKTDDGYHHAIVTFEREPRS